MSEAPAEPIVRPTVEEVATQLGKTITDGFTAAYDAEVADQASRCRVEPYTDALGQALVRRVQRSLAMVNLPLGVTIDENAVRVGSVDPEVRRLEAPYRKLLIG